MKVSANKLAVVLLGAMAIGWSAGVPQASAQNYPSRNITAIIPFAAGNANDVTARIVFEQLQKQLGQPIIIESKPGAGGTIGVGQAARANPDGYTLLFHSATFSASYVTHKTLPYDTLNDFTPVSAVGISPSVLVAAPSKGYKTAADLIAAAKAKPGELNYASAGIGAASHLAAEKFRVATGIKAQHIPFKGPVEALAEVMAGRIDYYFLPLAAAISQIRGGSVTALAVSSDKRAPQLPEVPTVAEIGYPAAAYAFWNGSFVPVKTPPDIVAKLHQEHQKAIADPVVRERLDKVGVQPLVMSQPEFAAYFKADVLDTDKLAKAAGIEKQ
jgi:tripartite-type tricarboxylate transporter receptor subunit TctC